MNLLGVFGYNLFFSPLKINIINTESLLFFPFSIPLNIIYLCHWTYLKKTDYFITVSILIKSVTAFFLSITKPVIDLPPEMSTVIIFDFL